MQKHTDTARPARHQVLFSALARRCQVAFKWFSCFLCGQFLRPTTSWNVNKIDTTFYRSWVSGAGPRQLKANPPDQCVVPVLLTITLAGSILTPGPMVEEMAIRLINWPLAPCGLAFCT